MARSDAEFMYTTVREIRVSGSLTDAQILADSGLLGHSYSFSGSHQFYIRPEGFQYYGELKQSARPAEAVENAIRGQLSSDEFNNSYAASFKKWSDAEAFHFLRSQL